MSEKVPEPGSDRELIEELGADRFILLDTLSDLVTLRDNPDAQWPEVRRSDPWERARNLVKRPAESWMPVPSRARWTEEQEGK